MSGCGALKLKKPIGSLIDKKKKKKNTEQATASVASAPVVSPSSLQANVDGMTKAERAFEAAQRKRESEMIEKKTAKSHRQKIEEFNAYLAKLPEHHDIPRVGPG